MESAKDTYENLLIPFTVVYLTGLSYWRNVYELLRKCLRNIKTKKQPSEVEGRFLFILNQCVFNLTIKAVPFPGSLLAVIAPPDSSIALSVMASPRPLPSCEWEVSA